MLSDNSACRLLKAQGGSASDMLAELMNDTFCKDPMREWAPVGVAALSLSCSSSMGMWKWQLELSGHFLTVGGAHQE